MKKASVILDGTLLPIDRIAADRRARAPVPMPRIDAAARAAGA